MQVNKRASKLCAYLSQRNVVKVASIQSEAKLPTDSLYILEGVHSWTKDKEDGSGRASLFVRHFKWNGPLLYILGTQLLLNVKSVKENRKFRRSHNDTS